MEPETGRGTASQAWGQGLGARDIRFETGPAPRENASGRRARPRVGQEEGGEGGAPGAARAGRGEGGGSEPPPAVTCSGPAGPAVRGADAEEMPGRGRADDPSAAGPRAGGSSVVIFCIGDDCQILISIF